MTDTAISPNIRITRLQHRFTTR